MSRPRLLVIRLVLVLGSVACSGTTKRAPEYSETAAADSATAVTRARAAIESVARGTSSGYAVAHVARQNGGFLVLLVPPCDTTLGVDSAGRAFRRGCGGGDYTVRVDSTGNATIVARGQ